LTIQIKSIMKKILILIVTVTISLATKAQTFYVHCEDTKSRDIIENKVKYEGFKVTDDKQKADYTLECKIWQTSKINSMYKGDLTILSIDGREIARSKEVRRGAVAVNGYNASSNIFGVIAKKELAAMLKKVK